MKGKINWLFLTLFAIVIASFLLAQEEGNLVKAWVDESCLLKKGTIKVPELKTATSFKLVELNNGYNYVEIKKLKEEKKITPEEWKKKAKELISSWAEKGLIKPPLWKGFGIEDAKGNVIYCFKQKGDEKPKEMGGPLDKLVLPQGEYAIFVYGGPGAKVVLSYEIK
ncbi:MAG: hypothetical protein J7L64_06070 [Acidobacteria bacterium]|nr:hypothetical protein [Acidobacteriota bacterium]